MQAARDRQNQAATSDTMFAGLSFPEVPSSLIIMRGTRKVLPQSQHKMNVTTEGTVAEPVESTSSPPPVVAAIMQSTSLASLYAPATRPVTSLQYPDLSSLASAPVAVNQIDRNNDREDMSERAALLVPPTAVRALRTETAATRPQFASNVGQSNELIHELMEENARLAEENAKLRVTINHIPLQVGGGAVQVQPAPGMLGQACTRPQSNTHPTILPTASANHMESIMGSMGLGSIGAAIANPALGIRIQGSHPPQGRDGIKYVCCGTCRQWLLSPRDAVYVFCPQCRSVNSCALLPPSQTTITDDVQAIRRSRAEEANYFFPRYILDCFQGIYR